MKAKRPIATMTSTRVMPARRERSRMEGGLVTVGVGFGPKPTRNACLYLVPYGWKMVPSDWGLSALLTCNGGLCVVPAATWPGNYAALGVSSEFDGATICLLPRPQLHEPRFQQVGFSALV